MAAIPRIRAEQVLKFFKKCASVAIVPAGILLFAGFLPAQNSAESSASANSQPTVRRITLEQAQDKAAQQLEKAMGRLGQLQIEAAKQHREGAESDYFPKVGASFLNLHFNKFMGQKITVQRPIAGGTAALAFPLAGKDQTIVATTAAQPITPLFKLHQVVNLARADERIAEARAKAGLPPQAAADVEEKYYGLLVAQRQLTIAKANANEIENKQLVASNASPPVASSGKADELLEAANALAETNIKVQELTASLNQLMGWPLDTELELTAPPPPFESISLQEATAQAMKTNVEVVTAEQSLAKARAASSLSKLEYVPDVAVLGGYAYNGNAIPLLPRDFCFIGLVGSFTLFDFGHREHAIKERKAQVEMAEIDVQLTKAKVAEAVKSSYLEMEREHQLSELRREMVSKLLLRTTSLNLDAHNLASMKAKAEAQMFEADLSYRKAIARFRETTAGQ